MCYTTELAGAGGAFPLTNHAFYMVRIPIVLDWTQTHECRQLVRKKHARKGGNFGIDSRRKNVGGSQTFINAQTNNLWFENGLHKSCGSPMMNRDDMTPFERHFSLRKDRAQGVAFCQPHIGTRLQFWLLYLTVASSRI